MLRTITITQKNEKMKKLFTLLLFGVSMGQFLSAQSFEKGTNVLSAGIGIGSSLGAYGSNSQLPGISANFERGMWEAGSSGVISIGGYVGMKTFKNVFSGNDYKITSKWNYSIIGIRSAYHYTGLENDKIDLYGGLMLSYNSIKYKWDEEWPNDPEFNDSYSSRLSGAVGFTGFLGGRYYFAPTIAAYLELGYGVSYLNIGVSLKF